MAQNLDFDRIQTMLHEQGYIADRQIAMSVYLSMILQKPLLIEGPAGVGKTEIAKVMARALDTDLIRLQCYEGLDAYSTLYEWNYQRQLLYIKMEERSEKTVEQKEATIFSDEFLLKRPILKAITHHKRPVLLIDELDRADEEFESFFLEALSDWQVTVPEIGTIKATHIPAVVITSNRMRELSDALRRRSLYLWIDYPSYEKEVAIIHSKLPDINQKLAEQIGRFMLRVRELKLNKTPGVAETLDWATALYKLHETHLNEVVIDETLGVVFKDREDTQNIRTMISTLMEQLSAA
jgi:MoxR-like ATPase